MGTSPANDLTRLLLATAAFCAAIASFNFVMDPLQIFHVPWLTVSRYSSNPRIGDAGLIRSQEFDTVFMGTSYSFQFRQEEIDESLGGRSLKLAISGGTSKEQNVVLSAALARQPKRIIWQIDDYMFRDSGDVDDHMPADLYRMNPKGIVQYLFSFGTSRESIWILLRTWKPLEKVANQLVVFGYLTFYQTDARELNTFPSGIDPSSVFNREQALKAYEQSLKVPATLSQGFDYVSMVSNFNRDALDLIRRNPDVRFVVYFPPSSILHWVAMREAAPNALQEVYNFSRYQLEHLLSLPNVAIHDFRDAEDITHDLNNYRDTIHHSLEVNRKILASIARA